MVFFQEWLGSFLTPECGTIGAGGGGGAPSLASRRSGSSFLASDLVRFDGLGLVVVSDLLRFRWWW
jgi:hypothetical protein